MELNNVERFKTAGNKKFSRDANNIIITLLVCFSFWSAFQFFVIQHKYQGRVNFLELFIEIILTYFILILIHEIGHLIFIKGCGYKLRVVLPYQLKKDSNSKINILKLFLVTSVVMDINSSVSSEREYRKFIRNYKKILLGGVMANIIILLFSVFLINFPQTLNIGFLLFVINSIFIVCSMLPLGDINRLIDIDKSPKSIVEFFIDYPIRDYEINDFCNKKIINYANKGFYKKAY